MITELEEKLKKEFYSRKDKQKKHSAKIKARLQKQRKEFYEKEDRISKRHSILRNK